MERRFVETEHYPCHSMDAELSEGQMVSLTVEWRGVA